METVKLSTLAKDAIVIVDGYDTTITVEDILEDTECFKNECIYTTIPRPASLNAKEILENAIDDECENEMYEDWDERIKQDISEKDIADMQAILDRILAKNPNQNIVYEEGKPIEIDV